MNPVEGVSDRLEKLETEIDQAGSEEPDKLENLLRRMRYMLHENHYLITDVKRKLIGRHTCSSG